MKKIRSINYQWSPCYYFHLIPTIRMHDNKNVFNLHFCIFTHVLEINFVK